jgi:hypothetical protein
MDNPAVTNALYWLGWMPLLSKIVAGLVAVGVVLEFAEGWTSEPWHKIVDDARTIELSRLATESELARAAIAQANARTAEAELELGKLRSNIQQRQLKPEQVSSIVSALSGKIPRLGVILTKDPEASRFAMDISANLSFAGLDIGLITIDEETRFLGFSDSPLFLYCTDLIAGPLIAEAFRNAGIPIQWNAKPFPVVPLQPDNSIYVSLRVPPTLGFPAYATPPK